MERNTLEIQEHIKNLMAGLTSPLKRFTYSCDKLFNDDRSINNSNYYAKVLLAKVIEQYVSLTYDGKPDYEIEAEEGDSNNLSALFDKEYSVIDKNLKQAIKDYFLNGYACLIINDNDGSLVNIDASKVYIHKDDDNILVVDDQLDSEQKQLIENEYSISFSEKSVKYVYYSYEGLNFKYLYIAEFDELIALGTTLNSKDSCYLDCCDCAELEKIAQYLLIYQKLSTNYKNALERLKLIVLVEPSRKKEAEKIVPEDNCIITISTARQADLPIEKQLQYLDNSQPAQIAELFKTELEKIKAQIYEIIGLKDIYGGEETEDTEETRIASAHRVSRELALWKYKQNNILLFVEKILTSWLSVIAGVKVTITLGSTNLLEKERKEQQKRTEMNALVSLSSQIVMAQSPALVSFYGEVGKNIANSSNLPSSIVDSFNNFVNTQAQIVTQQIAVANQANQPNQAAQVAQQLQLQGMQAEVAGKEADVTLKQAQAQKAVADANNSAVEANLKPLEVENAAGRVAENQEQTDVSAARENRIEQSGGILSKVANFFKRGN